MYMYMYICMYVCMCILHTYTYGGFLKWGYPQIIVVLKPRNFWESPVSPTAISPCWNSTKRTAHWNESSVHRAPAVQPSLSLEIWLWDSASPRPAASSCSSASPYGPWEPWRPQKDVLGPKIDGLWGNLLEIFSVMFLGNQNWWILEGWPSFGSFHPSYL